MRQSDLFIIPRRPWNAGRLIGPKAPPTPPPVRASPSSPPGSGTVGVASPDLVVANARAFPDPGQPQVDDARLAQAQQDADAVDDQGHRQDPDRAEHQKQLRRDHGVDDEVAVGDARKHLRARQGREQGRAVKLVQGVSR